MKRLEAFRIYYNQTIHPELMRMEIRRKRLIWLIVISLTLIAAMVVFELYVNILAITLFVTIPIGIYISWLLYQVQKFRQSFKPNIINLILDFIDDDINYNKFTYDSKKSLTLEDLKASQIFVGRKLSYLGEDYIRGRIGNFDFELSEVLLQDESPITGKPVSLFKGIFVKSEFDFDIQGTLLILPKSRRHLLARSMQAMIAKGGINYDDQLLDAPFLDVFTTYVDDPEDISDEALEAGVKHVSYILKEGMQRAIIEHRKDGEQELYISFINRHVYILLEDDNDFLEPLLFTSNVSFDLVKGFFEDVQLMLSVVEDFDRFY